MKIISEQVLYDTDGHLIQAHGGSIITINGKYFLYGESKEGVTGKDENGKWPRWHTGIKLYSSSDLVSWKCEGYVQKPSTDPWNPFYPTYIMDRPHVLYNRKTGKYVCWVKSSYDIFCHTGFSILVGDSLLDMKYQGIVLSKDGNVGDFDLFEEDGKGYVIVSVKSSLMVSELNETYTDFGAKRSYHVQKTYPPFVREAPCFFRHGGRKFLLTSGTTGYYPNRTVAYDITNLHGRWKELGYVCLDDKEHNSFRCQFSSVFAYPGKDLLIAVGDRWINDEKAYGIDYEALFETVYRDINRPHTPEWEENARKLNSVSKENVSLATYVWLPIDFDEKGNPKITYRKEWEF